MTLSRLQIRHASLLSLANCPVGLLSVDRLSAWSARVSTTARTKGADVTKTPISGPVPKSSQSWWRCSYKDVAPFHTGTVVVT